MSKDAIMDTDTVTNPAGGRRSTSKRTKGGRQPLNGETATPLYGSSLEKSRATSQTNRGHDEPQKKSGSCSRKRLTAKVAPEEEAKEEAVVLALTKEAPLVTLSTKPLKRKRQKEAASTPGQENILLSTSSVVAAETLGSTHGHQKPPQDTQTTRAAQPTKRQKKKVCADTGTSASAETQETKGRTDDPHAAKENRSDGKVKTSPKPLYFEMTPFVNTQEVVPSPSQVMAAISVAEDVFLVDAEVTNYSGGVNTTLEEESQKCSVGTRRVTKKPRKLDKRRRKGRVFDQKGLPVEVSSSVPLADDTGLSSGETDSSGGSSLSRSLLRSHSCPEIPSLLPHEAPSCLPPLLSLQPSRFHMCQQNPALHVTPVSRSLKTLRRARRHTVCSMEVAREIPPLCLRKEVYPSRRSAPLLSPHLAFPSSPSLSPLASCFLSSPLAFLSKKPQRESPAPRGHLASPASSSSPTSGSCAAWFPPRGDAGTPPSSSIR